MSTKTKVISLEYLKLNFVSLIGFAKYRRSQPVTFTKPVSTVLPEMEKIKLN